MKSNKLSISNLKVQSFMTSNKSLNAKTVKGAGPTTSSTSDWFNTGSGGSGSGDEICTTFYTVY